MDRRIRSVGRVNIFHSPCIVILSFCLLAVARAAPSGSLPPGIQLAEITYYDGYGHQLQTLQQAVASSESVLTGQQPSYLTFTFDAARPCISIGSNYITYINGVAQQWCASAHAYGVIPNTSPPVVVSQESDPWVAFAAATCPPGAVHGLPYMDPNPGTVEGGAYYERWLCEMPTLVTASIVAPFPVTIPVGSGVVNKRVLTEDTLFAFVTDGDGGRPVSGTLLSFQSSRSSEDEIAQPTLLTDESGETSGTVATRHNASGATSAITPVGPAIQSSQSKLIAWLPAIYGGPFLVTCYVISLESDFLNTPLVTVPGIPGKKYRQGFIEDTRMQGTGEALNGSYIKYIGHGIYALQQNACISTKSGACAADGVTVAVDANVIPLHSRISIGTVGDRAAQDTGGGISGDHIDLFYGTRRAACDRWGVQPGFSVTLLNYGI